MKTTTTTTVRPAAHKFSATAFAVLVSLLAISAQPASAHHDEIFFGDDYSEWAFDGECDDPRFAGPGTAWDLFAEDAYHDATDCYRAYVRGSVWLRY